MIDPNQPVTDNMVAPIINEASLTRLIMCKTSQDKQALPTLSA